MDRRLLAVKIFLFLLTCTRITASLECYACSNATDINKCTNVVQCSTHQTCFHDLSTIGQTRMYSLGCTDKNQCGTHRVATELFGRGLQGQNNDCHECCSSDKCNKPLCEHFKPSSCIDDHKIDCAYLNTVTNICSDTQHAWNICPRFCDLCTLVDGKWSVWSTWSSCSVTCGNGKRTKIRTCTNPAPTSGGLNCTGSDTRVSACRKQPCSAVSTRTTTVLSPTSIRPTRTTTMNSMKGNVKLCPERIQQLAAGSSGEHLAQFGQNCYEIVNSGVSWSHAEAICKGHGGHLLHIANQQEQDFIFDYLVKHHTHTVWLGLNDRHHEEQFEWTSGNTVKYKNFKHGRKDNLHHNVEDCVVMSPTTGKWDDVECGGDNSISESIKGIRHAFICQHAAVIPPNTSIDGNISMCPHRLQLQAQRDHGTLAQHDQSCYELVPNEKVSWQHAEQKCSSRGGHLVFITSSQEQNFIQGFMKSHFPDHAVWIGLTDQKTEGHFHWASGAAVHYTNWIPGHMANHGKPRQENCVVMIPYKHGQWDDMPCGHVHHTLFGGTSSSGETHPLLCEYSISTGSSLIG